MALEVVDEQQGLARFHRGAAPAAQCQAWQTPPPNAFVSCAFAFQTIISRVVIESHRVASVLLLTEATTTELPEEKKERSPEAEMAM